MGFFKRRALPPPQLAPLPKPLSYDDLKKGKRNPPNAYLWTEESLAALQRFLRDIWSVQEGGLPAGQFEGAPTQVRAGEDAESGSPELGWSPGIHKHPIYTTAAVALTPLSTNTEGSGPALARSTHTHDMSQVEADVMSKVSLGF